MKSQSWQVAKTFNSIYAGGKLCISQDGSLGYALYKDKVISFSLETYQVLSNIGDDVTCFDLTKAGNLVTSGVDNLIRYHKDPPQL